MRVCECVRVWCYLASTHTHWQTAKPHAFSQSETEVHKRKCRQIQYVWAWHGGGAATVCAQNVTQWQRRQRRWRQQRHRRLQHNQTNFDAGWGSTGPTNICMHTHTQSLQTYININLHLPDVCCCCSCCLCYCCFLNCGIFCWCRCSWRFAVVFVVAKNMFHLKQKTTTLGFCCLHTHTHREAHMNICIYVCMHINLLLLIFFLVFCCCCCC